MYLSSLKDNKLGFGIPSTKNKINGKVYNDKGEAGADEGREEAGTGYRGSAFGGVKNM